MRPKAAFTRSSAESAESATQSTHAAQSRNNGPSRAPLVTRDTAHRPRLRILMRLQSGPRSRISVGSPPAKLILPTPASTSQSTTASRSAQESRDQAWSASARTGGAAAVAFLGGAVLGGIITAMLANRNSGNKPEDDG